MMAFSHGTSLGDDDAVASFHVTTEVGLYFYQMHLVIPMHGVNLVTIEKHAQVIDATTHILVLPWAFWLIGGKHLQAMVVYIDKDVELPVVVTDAGSPDAIAIDTFFPFKVKVWPQIQFVKDVSDKVPIHQVLGMKQRQTRLTMHGTGHHIEVLAHPDHVRVGKLIVKQGIGIGPVPIICRP